MNILARVFGKSKKDLEIENLYARIGSISDSRSRIETAFEEAKERIEILEKYHQAMMEKQRSLIKAAMDEAESLRRQITVIEEQKANLERRLSESTAMEVCTEKREEVLPCAFAVPEEGFSQESHDHILIAIKERLKTLGADCRNIRHREILRAIVERNPASGNLACRVKAVREMIARAPQKLDRSFFRRLEDEGVQLVDEKNHWKIAYMNLTCPIPKTPSDVRARANCASDIVHKFFF